MNMNSVAIIGNVVRDVELKYTDSGKAVVNLSIAVETGWGENKKPNYFNCVGWQKTAELIAQYVKKGNKVGIEGWLEQKQWQDKDGNKRSTVEIVVDNCQFLTPKSESSTADDVQKEFGEQQEIANVPDNPFSDDDIPF